MKNNTFIDIDVIKIMSSRQIKQIAKAVSKLTKKELINTDDRKTNLSFINKHKMEASRNFMKSYKKKPDTAYIKKAKSDCWGTPKNIRDKYEGYFDPCPYPRAKWDGLEIDWKSQNFVNPPYSDLKNWCKKCKEEYEKGNEVILLIPARTDTKYFHEYVLPYAEITFIKGRLKYIDLDNTSKKPVSAPFPSIICHYKPTSAETAA